MDLAIVSGARPDLLEKTINSLIAKTNLKSQVNEVRINIDLFGGDEIKRSEAVDVVKGYFDAPIIRLTEHPSHTNAVKWCLKSDGHKPVFMIEDDWVFLENFDFSEILEKIYNGVEVCSFATEEKRLKGSPKYHQKYPAPKILSYLLGRRSPIFTTSPCIMSAKFAKLISDSLDPNFDPEKQMYNGTNPSLQRKLNNMRNELIYGKKSKYIIEDIGRAWRNKRGIEKIIVNGKSEWIKK